MRFLLGISAFYHDSAAVLLDDGVVVAAAEEERWTRKKHDASFPKNAVAYCLEHAGIDPSAVDLVCYYEKPLRKLERLLESYLAVAPRGFASFRHAMPMWAAEKLFIPRAIARGLGDAYRGRVVYASHHESHAAAAFFPSPYERAAILTCDGVGEWATTSWGLGEGRRITLGGSIEFPHSLGLLYSAFTYFAGFKVNSGEYKLMGLAPYGRPVYADVIRRELIDLRDDGSFRLDQSYFSYTESLVMTGARFASLFGGPRREPEAALTQREADLAASVQAVLEEALLRMARHVHAQTNARHLCLAGGVALNCVANARLLREGPFESIWVQPAAGDAGAALGAAQLAWHQLLGRERTVARTDGMQGAWLGPSFDDEAVHTALVAGADSAAGTIAATRHASEPELLDDVAALLADGSVVGWFQGRMEFGPRALGSRSILADARHPRMQAILNAKIKLREGFRPFAPSVLRERCHEFFEVAEGTDSPYMTITAQLRPEQLVAAPTASVQLDGREDDFEARAAAVSSMLPAVTHVDGSARFQTVDEGRHGRYYRLLRAFEARTGCPVLVNTSFNVRGEPIVRTPAEALACFFGTDMDALVLGSFVVRKSEQSESCRARFGAATLPRFELD